MNVVSIVTVCLNSRETINDTISSVSSQSHPCIEYIIIDGGSTDGTLDLIAQNRDRISKFISKPDNGIYSAMNKGISMATGDVIGFINSDDFYANNSVVSGMVNLIENNKLDAAYADLDYVKPDKLQKVVRCWKAGEYTKGSFRKGWVPPHPTFFCRKEIYEKYGLFREDFEIAADFELMLRFMEKYGIEVGYFPQVVVKMRAGGKANVTSGMIKGNLEILRAFRINGFGIPLSYFLHKPMIKLKQLRKSNCLEAGKNQD